MAIQVNKITNAAVYIDGGALLGQVSEMELPTITQVMTEHAALGMVGKFELPSGVEAMMSKFTFNSFYKDSAILCANPNNTVSLQVRASNEAFEAGARVGSEPVRIVMRGQFKNFPLGNYKQHEVVELEVEMNVVYVKLTIGTTSVLEFDASANIYKVNGVDILAQYRADIGQS